MPRATQVPAFTEEKTYVQYRSEVYQWLSVTSELKEERGILLALAASAPNDGLREALLGPCLGLDRLTRSDGAEAYLKFLERRFDQSFSLASAYERYENVHRLRRRVGQTIESYLKEFESVLEEADRLNIHFPPLLECFALVDGSNLASGEKARVLNDFGYNMRDIDTLPHQIRKRLRSLNSAHEDCLGDEAAASRSVDLVKGEGMEELVIKAELSDDDFNLDEASDDDLLACPNEHQGREEPVEADSVPPVADEWADDESVEEAADSFLREETSDGDEFQVENTSRPNQM